MEPLAVVTRNHYIESLHHGYVCIVNSRGNIVYSLGDYTTRIFFRSSAKPIQAIPLLQSGAADALGFSKKEIAVACSSHSGEKIHQKTVEDILKRIGLAEGNLHCGTMNPYSEAELKRLLANGESPSVFHCSCSGKHTAMLSLAIFRGYSVDDYEKPSNPVQQEILKTVAYFTDVEAESISIGTDGCGAPIFLLPIYNIALAYAKLSQYTQDKNNPYHYSCKTIFDSMTQHPEMVAGENEFCTELMRATGGKLIGKVGCEAVYCLGIKKDGLGICIKIADGNERAVYPVVIQILRDIGILEKSELANLENWNNIILNNNLNEETGRIMPCFDIKSSKKTQINIGERIKN
ncbi:MAG: L-asparaginase [Firmicutes bacterium HGW-Firmicutes-16]|nr:MAG: L-asparaginase [Firmicutes bacterium HGW-Firmicutes-16]